MKKYLKIGAIILALVMLVSLAACGGDGNKDEKDTTTTTEAPAIVYNKLSLTNDADATVELQYPDAFTYTEENQGNKFLLQTIHKNAVLLRVLIITLLLHLVK